MAVNNIIFDLDGTLVDSSDGVVEAVNYSLRQLGQPEQPAKIIKPFIGYPLATMYASFTDAPVSELVRHFRDRAQFSVINATQPLDGVEAVLSVLRSKGYRMAIATTKIKPYLDAIVELLGWESLFCATVGGDEVMRVKPHPEALILALERMGAPSDQALVVGDTINDIEAAQAVPMPVVAVASPYGGSEAVVAAQPNYFINSIAELPNLLDEKHWR